MKVKPLITNSIADAKYHNVITTCGLDEDKMNSCIMWQHYTGFSTAEELLFRLHDALKADFLCTHGKGPFFYNLCKMEDVILDQEEQKQFSTWFKDISSGTPGDGDVATENITSWGWKSYETSLVTGMVLQVEQQAEILLSSKEIIKKALLEENHKKHFYMPDGQYCDFMIRKLLITVGELE